MGQKQSFTNVTPISQGAPQQQTFTDVAPITSDAPQQDQGGSTARFLTRATGLPVHDIVEHPGAYLNPFSKEYWDKGQQERSAEAAAPPQTASDFIPGHQTLQDISDKNYAGAAGDVFGTVAKVAPLIFGGSKEIAPGETPPVGPKGVVTAPIRMAARAVEAGVNSKLAATMKAMTPADEAAASPIKVPGRDFGLPKRGSIAQAMDPASSPSRTLPGQISPERIAPPAPQPAAPIPPRSGLSLPPAPVGAELADLPSVGAKPAGQTGEALAPKRGQLAAKFKDPGAPLPENSPQSRLPEAFHPPTPKVPPVPGTVDNPFQAPPQRGSIAKSMQQQSAAPPIQRGALSKMLSQQLGDALGAKELNPKLPLRQQIDTGAPDMPQGHTAVNSSAMKSYQYDPAAKEFHARYSSGGDTTHVFGDVSPDEAQAFEQAPSKGQAMQTIKNSHPLVAKIVNGKRVAVRGSISSQMQK